MASLSDKTEIGLPLKNLLGLLGAVATAVWAYFGIVEKLNQHSTTLQLYKSDLEKNTEFRIGWPRGTLGSLPADSEQFMLIEDLYKQVEKLQVQQEAGMHNKVNIEFLQKQVEKLLEDVEELKDKARDMHYKNGNGSYNQ